MYIYVYIAYTSFSSLPDPSLSLFHPLRVLFYCLFSGKSIQCDSCCPHTLDVVAIHWSMMCCWDHTLREKWPFFWQLPISRDGTLCHLRTPCWGFTCLSLCRPCSCCYKHCTFICAIGLLCQENGTSLELSVISASYNLPGPSSRVMFDFGCTECGVDISSKAQHCALSCSLTVSQLWVSALIVMNCKKKLLYEDWMYWYSTKPLGLVWVYAHLEE